MLLTGKREIVPQMLLEGDSAIAKRKQRVLKTLARTKFF
jgi:hypothetical protein